MKALILNSGLGSRMGAHTQQKPKCMAQIGGGYTILSRQLTQLAAAGVGDIVITTGPFADALAAHVAELRLPIQVTYVHCEDYATTNYIVSMHRAAPHLRGHDVLLLHGDLVLESSVYADLLQMKPCPCRKRILRQGLRMGALWKLGYRCLERNVLPASQLTALQRKALRSGWTPSTFS